MEGGEIELVEFNDVLPEGGQSDRIEINPFHLVQHYMINPRKPEEFIPDNRVFTLFKK